MLGHANIQQTSTYLNATLQGLHRSMKMLDRTRRAKARKTEKVPPANARQCWPQFGEQLLARLCRRDAAGRAREQAYPDLLLESSNRVAERGLRHAEPFCGLSEALLVSHGQERGHHAQFISYHS
jgi:hypothetical protein